MTEREKGNDQIYACAYIYNWGPTVRGGVPVCELRQRAKEGRGQQKRVCNQNIGPSSGIVKEGVRWDGLRDNKESNRQARIKGKLGNGRVKEGRPKR